MAYWVAPRCCEPPAPDELGEDKEQPQQENGASLSASAVWLERVLD
jgi:hypothetical protein